MGCITQLIIDSQAVCETITILGQCTFSCGGHTHRFAQPASGFEFSVLCSWELDNSSVSVSSGLRHWELGTTTHTPESDRLRDFSGCLQNYLNFWVHQSFSSSVESFRRSFVATQTDQLTGIKFFITRKYAHNRGYRQQQFLVQQKLLCNPPQRFCKEYCWDSGTPLIENCRYASLNAPIESLHPAPPRSGRRYRSSRCFAYGGNSVLITNGWIFFGTGNLERIITAFDGLECQMDSDITLLSIKLTFLSSVDVNVSHD